jgi:hypothetical protein
MRWTYILRNRERWEALPESVKTQAGQARKMLESFGLTDADLQTIATDRIVEVEVPFVSETADWEARIFPWEFVLAGATREARHGEPLTVMRRLVMPGKPPLPRTRSGALRRARRASATSTHSIPARARQVEPARQDHARADSVARPAAERSNGGRL